ncbi:hypothetical protein [Candidatus Entotheonella palauensis]|nr:hypothetical protein [Candidatus Entotheonella palauensis]
MRSSEDAVNGCGDIGVFCDIRDKWLGRAAKAVTADGGILPSSS